ncbi:MAG TPA: hypothetical protein VLY87_02645 [Flavobacterium sp.]|nr:hypothetical protein [Flavobacterium sp.]
MAHCALCSTELKFTNTPSFGAGNLNDGSVVCRSCFKKTNRIDPNFAFHLKKHSLEELKNLKQSKKKNNSSQDFSLKGSTTLVVIVAILFFTVKSCFFGSDSVEVKKEIRTNADGTPMTERQIKVEDQFSNWDGSHLGLKTAIKEHLNDPNSFEHIETRFKDNGDFIYVFTTFTAKNGFGGRVKQTVSAKVDFKGNVIEILSQE